MGNLRLVLAVVAASVFSTSITALVMGRGGETGPPTTMDSGQDLTELTATLADFVRTMQSFQPLSTTPPGLGVSPDPLARRSLGESAALQAIAGHLEELKGLVGAQFQRGSWTGASSSAGLPTIRGQYVDTQWGALEDLREKFSTDRDGTSQSLLLLTPAVVLQRYGMPTQISVSDRGIVVWYYARRKPGGYSTVTVMTFNFLDGYVISAG